MHTLYVIHILGIVNVAYYTFAFVVFDRAIIQTGYCYVNLLLVGLSSFFVHWFYSKAY